MPRPRTVLSALCLLLALAAPRDRLSAARASIERILEGGTIDELLESGRARVKVPLSEVDAVRTCVWEKHRREQLADPRRREEHDSKQLRFAGATLRYEAFKVGKKPDKGYPLYIALHGGGGGPARMNDSQWRHMTVYYRQSVKAGVYVAPRGVSNTWNLHFRRESYPLYDRLIENMILFEDVDPDRVYLLGFSAGGDGVYQIVPRMADRWAAASMSAGHHNGVSPKNLHHVPFLLQVGERDGAYNRNRETVKFEAKLEALAGEHPGGYIHEIFVHRGKPHNFLDNHPEEEKQQVLADPQAWLEKGETRSVARNTNAIAWVSRHRRDPYPAWVLWDLKTRADRSGRSGEESSLWNVKHKGRQHYWLDLNGQDAESPGTDEVLVKLDPESNAVVVEKAGSYLRVLLTRRMLDLSKPVTFQVGACKHRRFLRPDLETMLRTVVERGDPRFIFEAECVLERREGKWSVSGAEIARSP